jgi:hypothetical protein
MAIGTKISASDYNNIRTKVERILGAGGFDLDNNPDPRYGYGQILNSESVIASDEIREDRKNEVTREQWITLRNDIINIKVHQDGSLPPIAEVPAVGTIRFGASHPNTNFDFIVTQAAQPAVRTRVASGRFSREEKAFQNTNTPWSSLAETILTVTFVNASQARYFFNSGGKIVFSSSRQPDVLINEQNNSWTSLLTAVGFQSFDGFTSGTKNFYNLTNVYQSFYVRTASGNYNANTFSIEVKSNVADNSSGLATTLDFRVKWTDNWVDLYPTPPDDLIDGTLSLTVEEIKAFGPLLPSGNFSIQSPTFSLLPIIVS